MWQTDCAYVQDIENTEDVQNLCRTRAELFFFFFVQLAEAVVKVKVDMNVRQLWR